MLTLLVFILGTLGLTFIITQSSIFEPFRKWTKKLHPLLGKMFSCPMCFGFWAGLLIKLLLIFELDFIIYGFIGSFVSYAGYMLLLPLIKKYDS